MRKTVFRALYAAETAVSAVEIVDRRVQIARFEVRPQHIGEIIFGVRRLPQKEVRRADLARGTDDEVRVGHMRRVKVRADGFLRDVLRLNFAVFHLLRDRAGRRS